MTAKELYRWIRAETYDRDIGQNGWLLAAELEQFVDRLSVPRGGRLLDIGFGTPPIHLAALSGCSVVSLCIDPKAIEAASHEIMGHELSRRVSFIEHDANYPLPLEREQFDGVLCIDLIDHLADRAQRLIDWARVLKPNGRMLFTDPIVVTGPLTDEEVRVRGSTGFTLFVPPGYTEQTIEEADLELVHRENLTANIAGVAARQHAARERYAADLRELEGSRFDDLQRVFAAIATMARENRLARFAYVARKQRSQPGLERQSAGAFDSSPLKARSLSDIDATAEREAASISASTSSMIG